jgi:FlaG/FlaF family flagellin (archaellin)
MIQHVEWTAMPRRRAVSPVIGVTLMVVLTVLLASVFAAGILSFDGRLDQRTEQFDDAVSTASANPWSGESGDLVRVSDRRAGATDVRYRINFTVRPGSNTIGNSLNSVEIDVTTGQPDMFNGTGQANLEKVVVDEDSDGSVDQTITGDVNGWAVTGGGSTLDIQFDGSAYTASADDSIVVVFDGVDNPTSPGTYDVEVETSGDGNTHSGTITIN